MPASESHSDESGNLGRTWYQRGFSLRTALVATTMPPCCYLRYVQVDISLLKAAGAIEHLTAAAAYQFTE
jgi:hypothetical protein